MLKYGIYGANGKMGEILIKVSEEFSQVARLEKLFVSAKFLHNNPNDKYTLFSNEEAKNLDFIIDFSSPEASLSLAKKLSGTGILIICGTTGFSAQEFSELKKISENVKILYSANFSLGVNKFFNAVKNLAAVLKDYEVEILEKHHSKKKDSPSGTALEIGKIIAKERGVEFEEVKSIDRNHLRKEGEIGVASIRQGKISGYHEVSFANENDRIWIGHEAFSKNIFAEGATEIGIKAFAKLKQKKSGFFAIEDI